MEFKFIIDQLHTRANKGTERVSETGAELVCPTPNRAPKAWLHTVFDGLKESEILSLEQAVGINIPQEFKRFLLSFNGLRIYANNLNVYGLRKNFNRDIISSRQPFDIVTSNKEERPVGIKKSDLVIGGYFWDGSLVVMTTENVVYRFDDDENIILNQWESLKDFLKKEIERLDLFFDSSGNEFDPEVATTPQPDSLIR